MSDPTPAAKLRQELAATYDDWPLDDPLVRVTVCGQCRREKLCRPCVRLPSLSSLLDATARPDSRIESQDLDLCKPCYLAPAPPV